MIHENKDEFLKVLESVSAKTDFSLALLEKDYYLSLILSGIDSLSDDLIFKGGTCLNKVYYTYYRLSEDLDFSMKLPPQVTRTVRRTTIKPVKNKIQEFVKKYGLSIEGTEKAGRNESKQYIYFVDYNSVVLGKKQSIKLEISLRFNPILPPVKQKVNHKFLHPFTNEPLFDGGSVNCLALKEMVSEKMRAAAVRLTIAPRDFYDLGFLLKAGFNFQDKELWQLFKRKLAEDGFETDLIKYRINLGRSKKEIEDMSSRIEGELIDVLTLEEKKIFHLQKTLDKLNEVLKDIE